MEGTPPRMIDYVWDMELLYSMWITVGQRGHTLHAPVVIAPLRPRGGAMKGAENQRAYHYSVALSICSDSGMGHSIPVLCYCDFLVGLKLCYVARQVRVGRGPSFNCPWGRKVCMDTLIASAPSGVACMQVNAGLLPAV